LFDVKKTFAAAPQLRQEIREDALDGGSGGKEIGARLPPEFQLLFILTAIARQPPVERLRLDLKAGSPTPSGTPWATYYRRLAAVVSRMASTLAELDKVFRNSLVRNVRELCQPLPSLNLARDQDLASLAREIEQHPAALDPALLRLDPATRPSAAQPGAARGAPAGVARVRSKHRGYNSRVPPSSPSSSGSFPSATPPPSPLFACVCSGCGEAYPPAGLPAACPVCGGCWRLGEDFAWRPPDAAAPGLRRWADALGLDPEELPARAIASPPGFYAPAGCPGEVWICQQGSAPVGSYKERGAEVMAAAARRRGISEMFLDSSGNAGIAVARAAAARGIRCTVLVPATTPVVKLERIRAAGSEVEVILGDRDATHAAAERWRGRLPYAAPFFQPSFLAGVATLAWDLAWEMATPLPEHWLLPTGNGPLLLGVALGLSCLKRAGLIDRLPALHAVQLEGYAALAPDGPGTARPGPPTAAGIAIAQPPRRTDLLRRIEETGGDVIRVSEEDIAAARRELAGHGWTTDPTGAAAFAGYRRCAGPRGSYLVIVTSREQSLG
jgi:threonine synthase